MTTGLTVSITEELVAEMEALADGACQYSPDDWFSADSLWSAMEKDDAAYVEKASPWLILALLAERAELLRDAERYRWLCDKFGITRLPCAIERILSGEAYVADGKEGIDAAIDAAMQSEARP